MAEPEQDGITQDLRSREDEYFRRKDRELVEKMRQAARVNEERHQLEAQTGIHDPALLQELEELGFTPQTVSLLPLVPIVQVAWAEGGISDAERTLILQFAAERRIHDQSDAGRQLAGWLKNRPSDDVFARAIRLVRAMIGSSSTDRQTLGIDDLVHHCEEIAAASGGVLGFRRISAEERALLGQIKAALEAK
jgi:hypothetical protein